MKKILLILIAFSSLLTYSQCMLNANFTFVSSGGTVSFTNTSTNEPAIPFYQWDYDGQSSTLENPTFPQGATDEYACFTVYDSTWSCLDSLCILIPGDSTAACNLNISWTSALNGANIDFTNTSTGAQSGAAYFWTYGGQTSTQENPSFVYSLGIPTICLTVISGPGGMCSDTVCGPVNIGGCNLNVSWTQSITGNNISFTNTSTGEPSGATYSWLYNGTASSLENPTFAYDSTITQVCFAISDPLGVCDDSICGPVYSDSTVACNLNISWTSALNGSNIDFTNTSTGVPSGAVYYWNYGGQTSSAENPSFFYSLGIPNVCLTILGPSGICSDTVCGPVNLDSTGGCNLNISWTQSINGGNISFTNTSTGQPSSVYYSWLYNGTSSSLENPTFVYDPLVTQVCFAISDLVGNCDDSICGPVYPDSTGCNLVADFTMTIDSGYVYFTNTSTGEPIGANYTWSYGSQSSSQENPAFMLDSGNSYACLTVYDSSWSCYDSTCFLVDPASASIENQELVFDATIYPNPVSNELFVSINSGQEISLIEIYDASGRLVYRESANNFDSIIQIDVNDLNTGVYIVNIQGIDDNIRFTESFLKR